ncbi:hypothetical protein [Acinetobacter sp. ANC 4178]|uniref:hypothetical protein n=1 Tax=Acinetobacter sp. ANC 4178 TaxID=2529839 RepID=UPI00103A41DB|nr:hypothetical protein [Acinetobacter sp. ANC 4178]TCB67518.1 hypothetical protein E0H87_04795 [Acinetobacter sp. ANC 4178]
MAMKKIKIEDIRVLSDGLYLQAIESCKFQKFMKDFRASKAAENSENLHSLNLCFSEKQQLLRRLEEFGDQSLNDLLWQNTPWDADEELLSFNPIFTARKTVILINQVDQLIEDYNNLDAHTLQQGYRSSLETLIDMITSKQSVRYSLLVSAELRNKIQGYTAIKQRHGVKHKIFFETLIEYADKHGKWISPSMAVRHVYVDVIDKFAEVDGQYIEKKLEKLEERKRIVSQEKEEIERIIVNIKVRNAKKIQSRQDDETLKYAEERQCKLVEELQPLEIKISKYILAKKQGYPFESLGREILFNSDIELSLINCLVSNQEIMRKVIVS